MADKIGLRLGIDGEREFKQALRNINTDIKTLGTEMKLVGSQFDANDRSLQRYAAENEVLSRTIAAQEEKAELLRAQLKKVSEAYGEDSAEAQKLKQQLNLTEAEINSNKKALDKNTQAAEAAADGEDAVGDSAKDMGNELDKSSDKVEKSSKALDALKVAAKAVAAAVAAVGAAAVKIGKDAIDAFGSYEQLVGGVETLFKDSSGIVMENARRAFQTAGLSANEYMETVTSFSASLIQSLGGDTEKAAAYADVALTDMSDNANKMGTDMQSIQNAYQGFAKQNYTMLDNLKLGYGGTKTEMERLLTDAEQLDDTFRATRDENGKLTMSFAEIVDAIHIVQKNIGITGTTALEADTTIQGSSRSIKAAWENLLVGMADNTQDFGKLAQQFTDSLITTLKNILPRVSAVLTGLGTLVREFAEKVLPDLLDLIVPQIPEMINNLVGTIRVVFGEVVPKILKMIVELVQTHAAEIIKGIAEFVQGIADWLTENLSPLVTAVIEILAVVINALLDNLPALLKAVNQIVKAISNAIIDNLPLIISTIIGMIPEIVDALIRSLPELIKGVVLLVTELVKSLPAILKGLWDGLQNIFNNEGVQKMLQIGKNLIGAMAEGITNALSGVLEKIKGACSKVVDGVKSFFGIHSPSKVFEGIGENLGLGLEQGFTDTMKGAEKSIAGAVPTDFTVHGRGAVTATADEQISLLKQQNALLQRILEKNQTIQIGDDVIGRANTRYTQNRGVILNGGSYAY